MYLAQGPEDVQNAEVALVLAVIFVAAFWRALLRLVLAALVVGVLLAVIYGVAAFAHAAHA
jgi:hypothetical protein